MLDVIERDYADVVTLRTLSSSVGRQPAYIGRLFRQEVGSTARDYLTQVRLEHAASLDGAVPAGEGLATQTIGAGTRLQVVDAIVSGAHESGTSHHELLRAFVDDATLTRVDHELESWRYRTHEFGDSILVERTVADEPRSLSVRQTATTEDANAIG